MDLEMDLNDVLAELNELRQKRQECSKRQGELLQVIEELKKTDSEDKDIFREPEITKEITKNYKQLTKEQGNYAVFYNREIELSKFYRSLIDKISEKNEEIRTVEDEISNIESKIRRLTAYYDLQIKNTDKSKKIFEGLGSEEGLAAEDISKSAYEDAKTKEIERLNKELEEKHAKLEELHYQQEIIFDKSKRKKEEPINKEEITSEPVVEVAPKSEEQPKEEDAEERDIWSYFPEVVDPNENDSSKTEEGISEVVNPSGDASTETKEEISEVVNPSGDASSETKEEIKESTIEEPTKNNNKLENAVNAIKNYRIDLKNKSENLMKKRPKLIKQIADWSKNHPTVLTLAAGAIAISLMAGGPIAALAATAGEATSAYIAYKSTLGKGK